MNETFCKLAGKQLRVEYDRVKPCCWYGRTANLNSAEEVASLIDESRALTDWPERNCNHCRNLEQVGMESPRTMSMNQPLYQNSHSQELLSLEIQIDRDCNAACLICGEHNSTTWEKYNTRARSIPISSIPTYQPSTGVLGSIAEVVDLEELRRVMILGGEPFKNSRHLDILSQLPNKEKISLVYTTNGSYRISSELVDYWNQFRAVYLNISIDAVGSRFEYLRWPLNWQQVAENIRQYASLSENIHVLSPFSYTVTALGLYYHEENVAWASTMSSVIPMSTQRGLFSRIHAVRDNELTLSAIPPGLRQAILGKYGLDHDISKLLSTVEYVESDKNSLLEFLDRHDQQRGLDWRECFPDIQGYFT